MTRFKNRPFQNVHKQHENRKHVFINVGDWSVRIKPTNQRGGEAGSLACLPKTLARPFDDSRLTLKRVG